MAFANGVVDRIFSTGGLIDFALGVFERRDTIFWLIGLEDDQESVDGSRVLVVETNLEGGLIGAHPVPDSSFEILGEG